MRPWEILPCKHPAVYDPSVGNPDYFYSNIVKPLVPDFIKLMTNGITIDHDAVEDLRNTVTEVLKSVDERLANNELIIEYQKLRYKALFEKYKQEQEESMRTLDFYYRDYKHGDKVHRTYLVNEFMRRTGNTEYVSKEWLVNDLKKVNTILNESFLSRILEKSVSPTEEIVVGAMNLLAMDKLKVWNKVRQDKIDNATPEQLLPPFNPGSSKQKIELFEMLDIEPLSYSKDTGLASWGRSEIEQVLEVAKDERIIEILEAFIDHSYSAIIRNNFIEAFDRFTIDGVLHGNFKLFGAKTFRPTSNSPNMLNAPSTGSIYAKPLKKCFIAPEGYLVWTIDYSALEDRVIANLSEDDNKLAVFTDGIDGHSLGATYYFPDKVAELIGDYTDNKQAARDLKKLVDEGNKDAKTIRQNGKPVTFKLAYGGYPDADKGGFITQEIFNAYHNEMYPSISKMRDEAIDIAHGQQYLHLGLGCRLNVDDVDRDSRTLFNALSQFWSVLTLISVNELHHQIELANMQDSIKISSTIYDAIYGIVKADAETIKWLNDTVCPIMEKDFMVNQIVHNEANLEIGDSWANVTELQHNVTVDEIKGVLDGYKS